jgi:zinc transport system ATP-binding protein
MPVEKFLLEVNNISFRYNNHYVLEDVSFKVKEGDYLGVIGPNGAGKTTLVKIILGLLTPERGEVKILGENIKSFKNRFLIGYVSQRISQDLASFPATVQEVILSAVAERGLFGKIKRKNLELVDNIMEMANLKHLKHKLLGDLSGGERQKVFIARALVNEPKILVLDEPSVGVDVAGQELFYSFIKKLNKEKKLTIILVSHDIDVVVREVNSILCLNKKVVYCGAIKEFTKSEYLDNLYGDIFKFIFHGH